MWDLILRIKEYIVYLFSYKKNQKEYEEQDKQFETLQRENTRIKKELEQTRLEREEYIGQVGILRIKIKDLQAQVKKLKKKEGE